MKPFSLKPPGAKRRVGFLSADIAFLEIAEEYDNIVSNSYRVNLKDLSEAVKAYRARFDPQGEDETINFLLKILLEIKKIDPDFYTGYMGAVRKEDLQLSLDLDEEKE